ncbi:MAG: glycosyltransferase, partial [Victivallales bacterium]|nr:glycosyltransferase [Victivallales bacterium]
EYLKTDRLDYKTLEILSDNEIQNQHPETAVVYLEDLLKAAPRDWEKMNLIAGVYMQLNDYLCARFWYQRSIEVNPEQDAIARKLQRLSSRVTDENTISNILPPSRILVVTNLYPPQELGGYGRSMFNFANELRTRGHEVRVLTSYLPSLDPCPEHEPFIDRSLELFGDWINGRIVNHPEPEPIILKNIATVTRVIRELKPDFILAGNLDLINYNIVTPILNNFNIPLIHHLGYKDNPFTNHLLPRHPRFFFAGASHWIMQRNITPGYTNCDFVYPGAKVRDFMLNTPVSIRRLNIAYASLVSRSKGIGTLVNALCVLKSQGIDFSCTIAGKILDQELYEELLHVSRCNGFEPQITFTGNLNTQELRKLYSRHNVLVFPSITPEAFGITPVEAMAAGLPVISTGQGGAAEVVEDGHSGIITSPGDHDALAEALISLLHNAEKWEKMGEAAKCRALEIFDISVSVDKLEKIFANMTKLQ